ncbi:extensin family protein [Sulfitobacter sp. LCG007]
MIRPLALVLLLAATAAGAAPESSLRPQARPDAGGDALPASAQPAPPAATPAARAGSAITILKSLRPTPRAPGVARAVQQAAKGAVCGDPDIQGERLGTVRGDGACGVTDAVRIRSVSGVALSQHAIMDCTTAKALEEWVTKSARPALRNVGGGLARLEVAAHYVCRGRNNQSGAKLSEHGRGHAIDISGFTLRDGATATVLRDWNSRKYGPALRTMRKQACGTFGTVLGPGSDRHHDDHFHFDTARYRSGAYCR